MIRKIKIKRETKNDATTVDTNNLQERVRQFEQLKFLPLDFTATCNHRLANFTSDLHTISNTAHKTQSRERQVILLKLHAKTIQVPRINYRGKWEGEGEKNKEFPPPPPACKSLLPTSRNSLGNDILYLSRKRKERLFFTFLKETGLIASKFIFA